MAVGDAIKPEVPEAPEAGPGSYFYRLSRVLVALRDQVQALTQRLEAKAYPPDDAKLGNSEVAFYVDEATNKLHFRVRYSTGVLKTGEVNLL